jgi:uncharacterized protein (TIGR03437 family)
MRSLSPLAAGLLAASTLFSATFGTATGPAGGAAYSDIVLDESRSQIYLVNSANNRIDIYNTKTKAFGTSVTINSQPVAAALGALTNGTSHYLYVTAYATNQLVQVDLSKSPPVVSTKINLLYNPEGVAVGGDGRVLVTTIGPGSNNSTNTLFLYDPTKNTVLPISLPVPPPTSPVTPTTPGREFLAYRAALLPTPNGNYVIGVNGISSSTRLIFVYEVASATVLRSREVTNLSNVLSVSPDSSRFMAGSSMFDISTLQVIAQENVANSPFAFPTGNTNNFNLQQNQGGSVFSPDGSVLYAAFNINPVQNPAANANTTILLINDPTNLLIQTGIQMPENLAGKMVIDKAGDTVYGISDTGFITLPVSTISSSPLVDVGSQLVFLANDQCGVTAKLQSAVNDLTNGGKGRLTLSVQTYTIPSQGTTGLGGAGGAGGGIIIGGPGGGGIIVIGGGGIGGGGGGLGGGTTSTSSSTGPIVQLQQNGNGGTLSFRYNPAAATKNGYGTSAESDFLIQSPEAINIPANIRAFQNNRDADARGQIFPVATNITAAEGLMDILPDYNRNRVYITNSGRNEVEVFDMSTQKFLAPIKAGQLPHNMALGTDGSTLYVANTGGESISMIDLTQGKITGTVQFPAVPLNAATSIITPQAMASTYAGPLVIMSDGSFWRIDGNQAVRHSLNQVVFGTNVTTIPSGSGTSSFRTMASSSEGQYVIIFSGNGNAYLYDASIGDFTMGKQIFSTQTGYLGPVAAGPRGAYYVVNGTLLNSSLTPIGNIPGSSTSAGTGTTGGGLPGFGGTTATTTATRPISAAGVAGATSYAVFSNPVRTSSSSAASDPGIIEILDTATGNVVRSTNALEGPASVVSGTSRVVVQGRTLALDSTGNNAYALTISGLSVIPLTPIPPTNRPALAQNGVVNVANYQPSVAPGSLVAIFGANLASAANTSTTPLPTVLGGTCVTLNNVAIPLIATTSGQVNGQIPTNLAAGRYPLVVRSISNQAASQIPAAVTVAKYAPAVFVTSSGQAAIYHQDGSPVTKDNPTTRDQRLVLYATGLGPTTGGMVITGAPSPSKPLAVTGTVSVYFGPSNYSQSAIAVEWSGLVPGMVGVYQVDLYVPGTHMDGNALPVMIKVGGVSSPVTGSMVPTIAIN